MACRFGTEIASARVLAAFVVENKEVLSGEEMKDRYQLRPAYEVADSWSNFCGVGSAWVQWMVSFGALGGKVRWWEGYPQSKSAVPLCFELFDSEDNKIPDTHSRLKDIKAAVAILKKK